MDGDMLLTYRFNETYFTEAFLKATHEGEGGCGFTGMLFGGSDEYGPNAFG